MPIACNKIQVTDAFLSYRAPIEFKIMKFMKTKANFALTMGKKVLIR